MVYRARRPIMTGFQAVAQQRKSELSMGKQEKMQYGSRLGSFGIITGRGGLAALLFTVFAAGAGAQTAHFTGALKTVATGFLQRPAWRRRAAGTSSSPTREQRGQGDCGAGRLHHRQHPWQRIL
jgi:hypothetical protein